MIFSNTAIDLDALPKVTTLTFKPLAKAWLKANYIGTFLFYIFLLIPTAAISAIKGEEFPALYGLLAGWLLLLLWSLWLAGKEFKYRGYSLREKDILYRKGVIFRSLTAVPFNRVQHVEIKQGPISRYFGLHDLEVYTAGGESSDMSIPGLEGDIAQQLKTFIIHQTTTTDEQSDIV